jgi:hypothetical protein
MPPRLAWKSSTTGFPSEPTLEGNEGYNAAQKAEEQLKLDFLSSFQNPQRGRYAPPQVVEPPILRKLHVKPILGPAVT